MMLACCQGAGHDHLRPALTLPELPCVCGLAISHALPPFTNSMSTLPQVADPPFSPSYILHRGRNIHLLEEAGLGVVDSAVADLGVAGWQWAGVGLAPAEGEMTLEAAGCRLAAVEEGTLAAAGWPPEDCAFYHQSPHKVNQRNVQSFLEGFSGGSR